MSSHAHLSNGGVDIYLEVVDGALVIRYWGKSVAGDISKMTFSRSIPNSDFDAMQNPGLIREHSRGWLGYPSIAGHRDGKSWSTKFAVSKFKSDNTSLTALLSDEIAKLELELSIKLDQFGAARINYKLTNLGERYTLNELSYWLPLSDNAIESLDFAGRWSKERTPQRKKIEIGRWVRESHEGRSGHNFTIGEIALCRETNYANGQAWSIALAWSGDTRYYVEMNYEGSKSIGASEVLAPGEMILEQGESYEAPELIAIFTDRGLDGLANGFHNYLRSRAHHPKKARPLTLNLWEAISFEHSEERVKKIVDAAAQIGVERVVLDDGWFGSRRNDRSGLGDWHVSKEVWPSGLKPIADYIASKGMEFGLWFEGEMLNIDSDLFRKHPDWILSEGGRVPPTWRHQLVLDLANDSAFNYVLESISKVILENKVKYIKWDHNRVLIDAGHLGSAGIHKQTKAIYRLFKELKARCPSLEIESCASGGARIDLGVIDYVDRFWVSDNNDALARQEIQRWTMQFIPPELLGTHIGPSPSHQTGRELSLSFRATTALFGHAGIEWDISQLDGEELKILRNWIDFYKEKRALLHSGESVRMDYPNEDHYLYGVVGKGGALFTFAALRPTTTSHSPNLRFRGLDHSKKYQVKALFPAGIPGMMLISPPAWLNEGVTTTGAILEEIGLPAPILQPAQALIIEILAI